MEILVVEDNKRISEFVVKGLEESGYSVVLAENGADARHQISSKEWGLILLDIMLPDIDGLEILQFIRYKKIMTPVLVLSALSDTDDKVKALNYGADDYLSKPFHFKELLARINALLRRAKLSFESHDEKNVLTCDDLTIDLDRHVVSRAHQELKLTMQEFKLLKLLMENKNKVLIRTEILDTVWGVQYDSNTNVVDVYISYLRAKIDASFDKKLIETVKGRGYVIRTEN